MTPTEMHIEALMEKIETLTKQIDEVTKVKERYKKSLEIIGGCLSTNKQISDENTWYEDIARGALNGSGK